MKRTDNAEDLKHIIPEKGMVIVDFFATWCKPCKRMDVTLAQLEEDMPDIIIVKVDVDQAGDIAADHKIRSMPTLVLYEDGVQTKKWEGNQDIDEIRKWIME